MLGWKTLTKLMIWWKCWIPPLSGKMISCLSSSWNWLFKVMFPVTALQSTMSNNAVLTWTSCQILFILSNLLLAGTRCLNSCFILNMSTLSGIIFRTLSLNKEYSFHCKLAGLLIFGSNQTVACWKLRGCKEFVLLRVHREVEKINGITELNYLL